MLNQRMVHNQCVAPYFAFHGGVLPTEMVIELTLRVLTLASFCVAAGPTELLAIEPIVSVCEVLDDPASYDGKVVAIRGILFGMYEDAMSLSAVDCLPNPRAKSAGAKAIALRVDESLPFEEPRLLGSLLLDRATKRDEPTDIVLTGRLTVFGLKERNGPYRATPQVRVLMHVRAAPGILQNTAATTVLSPCDLSIRGSQLIGKRLSIRGKLQFLIRYKKVGLVADHCGLLGLAPRLSLILPLVLNSEFQSFLGEVREKEIQFPKARILDNLEVVAEGLLQSDNAAIQIPDGLGRLPFHLVDVSLRSR